MNATVIALVLMGYWGDYELGARNEALSGAGITMVSGAEAMFQNPSLIADAPKLTLFAGFYSPFGFKEVSNYGAAVAFSWQKRFGVGIGYKAQTLLEIYSEKNFIVAFAARILNLKGIDWDVGTNVRIFRVDVSSSATTYKSGDYSVRKTAFDWATTLKSRRFALAIVKTNAGNTEDLERKIRYEVRLSPLQGFNSMFTYWSNGVDEGYGIGQEISILGVLNLRIGYSKDGVTMGFGINSSTYRFDAGVHAAELGSTFHISISGYPLQ